MMQDALKHACEAYRAESTWPAEPDAMRVALKAAEAVLNDGLDVAINTAYRAYAKEINRDPNPYAIRAAVMAATVAAFDRPTFDPAPVLAAAQPLARDLMYLANSEHIDVRAEMDLVIVSNLIRQAGLDLLNDRPRYTAPQAVEIARGVTAGLVKPRSDLGCVEGRAGRFPRMPAAQQGMELALPDIREQIADHADRAGLKGPDERRAVLQIYAAAIILAALGQALEASQGLSPEDGQALAVRLALLWHFPESAVA